jgi:hypothetical protein
MKKVTLYGEEIIVYAAEDLYYTNNTPADAITKAKELWNSKTQEYVKNNGDIGTCVLGAGIEVWFLPTKCKKPRKLMIIGQPCCAQGSICWEHSVDEIIAYLKEYGIEANYNCGFMD